MKKLQFLWYKINISRVICDHLFSKSHSDGHRIGIGFLIGAVGVSISQIETSYHSVHYLLDGIGYGIHGIGVAPIIDKIASYAKKEEKIFEHSETEKPVEEISEV